MNNNTELKLLYDKYIHNQLSEEEIRGLLITLGDLSSADLNALTKDVLQASSELQQSDTDEDSRLERILGNVKKIQGTSEVPVRTKMFTWISVAAAVLIITSIGLFFLNSDSLEQQALAANLKPGGNKAILTLANGTHITLDNASNGNIAREAGVLITKTANGQLVYTISDQNKQASKTEFNSIETPRGGQYKVILPDHSSVWLNAASSLRYPASFAGSKNRVVELNGEAYFEVAKSYTSLQGQKTKQSFIVISKGQQVEVLGTHFNITSYADEAASRTTLLEGSVRISSLLGSSSLPSSLSSLRGGTPKQSTPQDEIASERNAPRNDGKGGQSAILKPGEQGVFAAGKISVGQANTEEALAWKNGYFRFNDENIESVMRKIARWYDVDVKFSGDIPQEEYNGKISRSKNIDQVLEMLGATKTVHFKIEGRRILVEK